jgi:hypothetical protein
VLCVTRKTAAKLSAGTSEIARRPESRSFSEPIFENKPRHLLEFSQIIGDDCEAFAAGVTPDHHVVDSHGLARSLEPCPQLTVMAGGSFGKRENVQPSAELLDNSEIFMRPR